MGKHTPEELREIRRAAGRKGGLARPQKRDERPRRQMSVLASDLEVLRLYGRKRKMTLIEVVHILTRVILCKHPEIKPPSGWCEEFSVVS